MKGLITGLFMTLSLVVAVPVSVYAVDVLDPVCTSKTKDSPVCKDKEAQRKEDSNGQQQNPIFGPEGFVTKIVSLLSVIAGIVAVITIILAGLKFVTSGSNPQDVNSAREMVIYAAVGLVIAASAQLIVRVFLFKIGD